MTVKRSPKVIKLQPSLRCAEPRPADTELEEDDIAWATRSGMWQSRVAKGSARRTKRAKALLRVVGKSILNGQRTIFDVRPFLRAGLYVFLEELQAVRSPWTSPVEREAETDPGSASGGIAVAVEWADL
jgi:hypothetical protein